MRISVTFILHQILGLSSQGGCVDHAAQREKFVVKSEGKRQLDLYIDWEDNVGMDLKKIW
jgi:hypothetical protein